MISETHKSKSSSTTPFKSEPNYKPTAALECRKENLNDQSSPNQVIPGLIHSSNQTRSDIENQTMNQFSTPENHVSNPQSTAKNECPRSSQSSMFTGHTSAGRDSTAIGVSALSSPFPNRSAFHTDSITGMDYPDKVRPLHSTDYPQIPTVPFSTPTTGQDMLHPHHGFTSYTSYHHPHLSSGSDPIAMFHHAPGNSYIPAESHPFTGIAHFPPFYNSPFQAASLLSPSSSSSSIACVSSSRTEAMGSFLTGLGDPWNTSSSNFSSVATTSASGSSSSTTLSGYPFGMPWPGKMRQITSPPPSLPIPSSSSLTQSSVGASTDLAGDPGMSVPLTIHSAADYSASLFNPKQGLMRVPTNGSHEYAGDDHLHVSRNLTGISDSPVGKSPFMSSCNYSKTGAINSAHSVFRLSSSYLPSTHSLAP